MSVCTPTNREITDWMTAHVHEFVEYGGWEINCTLLVEDCAEAIHVTDDGQGAPIWDIAVEVAERYEGRR